MPLIYRMHATLPLMRVRLQGPFTLEDIRSYAVELRQHPRFGPDLCELVEMQQSSSHITASEWMEYQIWRNALPPLDRSAIVAPTDAEFGAVRMYEQAAARSGGQIEVFRDLEKAIAWLGFPADQIEVDWEHQ